MQPGSSKNIIRNMKYRMWSISRNGFGEHHEHFCLSFLQAKRFFSSFFSVALKSSELFICHLLCNLIIKWIYNMKALIFPCPMNTITFNTDKYSCILMRFLLLWVFNLMLFFDLSPLECMLVQFSIAFHLNVSLLNHTKIFCIRIYKIRTFYNESKGFFASFFDSFPRLNFAKHLFGCKHNTYLVFYLEFL